MVSNASSCLNACDNLTYISDALLEPSDEEVLAASDISESEDDSENAEDVTLPSAKGVNLSKSGTNLQDSDSEASAEAEEDEFAGGWGTLRQDYYDADQIETEADALEEETEAKRLQQKQLQGMTEADFGFDEVEWLEAGKDEEEDGIGYGKIIREVLPKLEVTDAMGPEERLKILRMRYPEFEPLAKEFLALLVVHGEMEVAATEAMALQQEMIARLNGATDDRDMDMPVAAVKHSALSAYLAALSMYFALLTSGKPTSDGKPAAMPPEELREHSIMEALVQCRGLWERIRDIALPDAIDFPAEEHLLTNGHNTETKAVNGTHTDHSALPKPRKQKKTKAQKAAEAAQAEATVQRAERLRKTEEDLADLSHLIERTKTPPKQSPRPTPGHQDSDSDFGEQSFLTPHEAAEKAKRKKSLKFYTSQIAQKANKRGASGRDAGGDADIPFRERLKDRQIRLNAEAEKRGKKLAKGNEGAELGGSSDDEDRTVAQDLRDGTAEEGEDYYDVISSRTARKKADKATLAAAHREAAALGGIVRIHDKAEEVGPHGKRGISYSIEKNKGLAPRRKKEVRNPRVKKRMRYEDKMKKLGSVRAVWRGGEERGGYGGERTGIKRNLVKSVKL